MVPRVYVWNRDLWWYATERTDFPAALREQREAKGRQVTRDVVLGIKLVMNWLRTPGIFRVVSQPAEHVNA